MKWPIFFIGMMIIATGAVAQNANPNYWVVEGNVNTRDYTLIRFYDSNNNMVYEETLTGKFLDITKKKNVKLLNRKLRDFDLRDVNAKKTTRRNRRPAV